MGRDVRPSDMFAKGCGKMVSPQKPSCDEGSDGLAKKAVLLCSFMFPDVLQVQLRRYGTLNLLPGASVSEVAAAYRRASLLVHPDRCQGDPDAADKFARLTRARDILLENAQRVSSQLFVMTLVTHATALHTSRVDFPKARLFTDSPLKALAVLDLGVERQQSPFSSESSSQSCLEKADLDVISQVSTRSSQSVGLPRKSRKRTKAKDFQRNSSASSSSTTDCPFKTLRGVCHRLARSLTWFGRLCSPSTACEDTLRKSPSEISTCPSSLCTPLDTFEREVSRRSYANRFIQFSTWAAGKMVQMHGSMCIHSSIFQKFLL
ncbi:spf31 [Symbiodinium sp. CCMP2592]|nr:spf31 [Symbiodinium sp. CCMP2592]